MAGGKETPRQKMVGLMYLVLMALLAMNVSKDILEAFVTINSGLLSTTENFQNKNQLIYDDFDKAKSINPQKVTPFWNKAQEVRRLSEELNAYIKSVRNTVIAKTEQITEEQADTLHLEFASKKDDYDTPTNVLIGDSHDGSAGLSSELRRQIESYKASLLKLLKEEDQDESKLGLDTKTTVQQNGVEYNWEMNNFYHTPLAASVTILSQIQTEIKNAEYYVISKLFEEFGDDQIPFDTVAAKVIATSNYVLQGEDYRAQLFLAAYSQTQQPKIFIGEYDSIGNLIGTISDTVNVQDGIGNYVIPTDKEGVFSYTGAIQMTTPNGEQRSFPFRSEYIVAKPNLVVSPTQMLVFYKGPENPVEISVPGIPSEDIIVGISQGAHIRKVGSDQYIVTVDNNAPRQINVDVKARMKDGTVKVMGQKQFEAKRMPDPYGEVGDLSTGGRMKKSVLCAQQGIKAKYSDDFVFKLPVSVTSFDVEFKIRGNLTPTTSVVGNRFDNSLKGIICNLSPGDKVYFSNIRAKDTADNRYKLSDLTIEIIN